MGPTPKPRFGRGGPKGRPAYSGLGVQKGGKTTPLLGNLGSGFGSGLGPPPKTSVSDPPTWGIPETGLFEVLDAQGVQNLKKCPKRALEPISRGGKGVVRQMLGKPPFSRFCPVPPPPPLKRNSGFGREYRITPAFLKPHFFLKSRYPPFWALLDGPRGTPWDPPKARFSTPHPTLGWGGRKPHFLRFLKTSKN